MLGPQASPEEPVFDKLGHSFLSALRAQGLPTVVGVIHSSDAVMAASKSKAAAARKLIARSFEKEFGADTKLLPAGTSEELKAMVRNLAGMASKDISWRQDRGYMLVQQAEYLSSAGALALRGYVRGSGWQIQQSWASQGSSCN